DAIAKRWQREQSERLQHKKRAAKAGLTPLEDGSSQCTTSQVQEHGRPGGEARGRRGLGQAAFRVPWYCGGARSADGPRSSRWGSSSSATSSGDSWYSPSGRTERRHLPDLSESVAQLR